MVSFCEWSLGPGSVKSLVADSIGMDQHLHSGSRNVPVLAGVNLLENRDISFRRVRSAVFGTAYRVVPLSGDSK